VADTRRLDTYVVLVAGSLRMSTTSTVRLNNGVEIPRVGLGVHSERIAENGALFDFELPPPRWRSSMRSRRGW
jgi:hypothetical protein